MKPRMTNRQLADIAAKAARNAYAPYSKYKVGAALETDCGSVFTGVNVENASFGLTICAERVAIAAAVAAGHRSIRRLAVAAGGLITVWPCGACRQVIAEFGRPSTTIIAVPRTGRGPMRVARLDRLLPHAFRFAPHADA